MCLLCTVGRQCFREFLKSEFSEENIEFWIACDEYKNLRTSSNLTVPAQKIFAEFVAHQAPREVRYLQYRATFHM